MRFLYLCVSLVRHDASAADHQRRRRQRGRRAGTITRIIRTARVWEDVSVAAGPLCATRYCRKQNSYIFVQHSYSYKFIVLRRSGCAQASRLATQLHVLHGKAGAKSRPNPNDDILARRGGCPLPNPFVTFFTDRTCPLLVSCTIYLYL